ncbi:MAG: glycosyltransferase family 39 protein [Candidatus Levybacteria bacterium]|nr:glycosyltransferase family 39 protein [Candidatus Levybacteria bacterium]
MNSRKIILIGIILLAVFLRFYQLSNVPPSVSLDEASIGYNAYSIINTSADEYGAKFPILLRAYDDWRPALYVYLVIPFVRIIGLSVLAVRLPSVILSILTVISTYFLVKELFKNSTIKQFSNEAIALLTSFLLAISPWHIYISRLGHEVNASLTFVILAILFLLKAISNSQNKFFLLISTLFFGLSLYTYQSEKIFVPLILFIFVCIFRKQLLKMKLKVFLSLIFGILLILPIVLATLTPQGLLRFKGTSAFNDDRAYKESADKILQYKKEGKITGEIFYNRRLVPIRILLGNYFSHFSPQFLFGNSGNESFKSPNIGLLYWWEFPFMALGIAFLFFGRFDKKIKAVIMLWFVASFVAPSLTTGAPHAMRAYNVLPIPQIFTSLGIYAMVQFIEKIKFKPYISIIFYFLLFVTILLSLQYFYQQYFTVFPKNQSQSFQYVLSKTIPFILKNQDAYGKIIFSNKDNLYQSYMFFLFYSKYDPSVYQMQGGTKSGGFAEEHAFSKFEFRPINWDKEQKNKTTLYIGNPDDFPRNIETLFIGRYLNDEMGIKAVDGL